MASDINIKTWGNKPPNALRFHFHSCSVDNHTDFDPTDEPSRNNQHGADRGDTKVNDEVKSFIRNVFYKQCDEPGQPQRQVSAKQSRHDDKMGRDLDPDSDSDGIPCHLDMDAILPELIKLNLAQHRMILSLCDLTKEAVLQLRITKARLDLVDEELSLMRSSVAEQAAPSLFSGVRTRSSLEVTERHRADHYIPRFNLADIGATLAAGPDPWSDLGHTRQRVRDGSPSLRSSRQRRRSPRPERYVPVPTCLARCPVPTKELMTIQRGACQAHQNIVRWPRRPRSQNVSIDVHFVNTHPAFHDHHARRDFRLGALRP